MLNKLLSFIRQQKLMEPGDAVTCAVSGGADSVALLFALYLLKEKLDIRLSAAHFNHHLRGAESDRDEDFVREFCHRYDIPLTVGGGQITAGKKVRRDWRLRPGMPVMHSCGACPARSQLPTPPMTMRKRC